MTLWGSTWLGGDQRSGSVIASPPKHKGLETHSSRHHSLGSPGPVPSQPAQFHSNPSEGPFLAFIPHSPSEVLDDVMKPFGRLTAKTGCSAYSGEELHGETSVTIWGHEEPQAQEDLCGDRTHVPCRQLPQLLKSFNKRLFPHDEGDLLSNGIVGSQVGPWETLGKVYSSN